MRKTQKDWNYSGTSFIFQILPRCLLKERALLFNSEVTHKPQFKRSPQFTWCLLRHAAIIVCGLQKWWESCGWTAVVVMLLCHSSLASCMTSVFQAGLFQLKHVLLWPTKLGTAVWETESCLTPSGFPLFLSPYKITVRINQRLWTIIM